jgi:pimeloyl-ACP methyl ester carboxylesterase
MGYICLMTYAEEQHGPGIGGVLRIAAAALVALGPVGFLVVVAVVAAFRSPAPAPEPGPRDVPVILVPGWFDEAAGLAPLARRLAEAGWAEDRVKAISFRDAVGSNEDHALEVAAAVAEMREATGSPRVDIVAHSMGGLAVRHFLATESQAEATRRVVFLGTPQRGTWVAYMAWGEGGQEMEPESEFLSQLNEVAPVPETVEAFTIRTPVDTHIVPGENATLPGVPDVTVCCPTHRGLVDHKETFRLIHMFLAEGRRGSQQPVHP